MNVDTVRVRLVKDVQNWDGTLSFRKDLILAADPATAQALVSLRAAVPVPNWPQQEAPESPAS